MEWNWSKGVHVKFEQIRVELFSDIMQINNNKKKWTMWSMDENECEYVMKWKG